MKKILLLFPLIGVPGCLRLLWIHTDWQPEQNDGAIRPRYGEMWCEGVDSD